ncbi:hypothetical protein B0I35DRAFT_18633 [Stachybotrys elegans]|uniref:Uncharacterized protein n=1 Tax=Stachybotrys elegans TaxID=80388 RepID=A0A8K0WWR6_9HYPO|nr:hypothetical protein B0I35DRAFT_18633 [Stachybotrys elegans]
MPLSMYNSRGILLAAIFSPWRQQTPAREEKKKRGEETLSIPSPCVQQPISSSPLPSRTASASQAAAEQPNMRRLVGSQPASSSCLSKRASTPRTPLRSR